MTELPEEKKNLIGIEITNSRIIAICIDNSGNVIRSFKTIVNAEREGSEQIIEAIDRAKNEFGDFESLGIAVPGLLDRLTNRVAFSKLIPEHVDIDLAAEIKNHAKAKVYLENDANAAAYGEFAAGAGRGSNDMFYITLGSGVGGALIFNKNLWHGKSGFAGEFGSIAINPEGLRLEDVASAENIVKRTKERFHQDTTSSLNEIGEENITIADIVREANNEDDFAQLMLQRTGRYVGTALSGVINLLNIEKVVIGGEIVKVENIVLEAIIEKAKELSYAPSFESVEIAEGILGENASAIGAALLSN